MGKRGRYFIAIVMDGVSNPNLLHAHFPRNIVESVCPVCYFTSINFREGVFYGTKNQLGSGGGFGYYNRPL